jgi:phospholipid transport system substrate-binding protein
MATKLLAESRMADEEEAMVIRARAPRLLLTVPTLVVALLASPAFADPPPRVTSATDQVRRHLDDIFVMAQSPSFRALEPFRRREAIRRIGDRLFNWPEMARRALGPEWRERSAAERRRFAEGFALLVERAYAGSIDQLGSRRIPLDTVRYLGETISGQDAVVRTALTYPRELPIDFLMSRRAGRWEVYDVRVDGVSAAENYRAQFRRVIADAAFPGLVDRMAAKTRGAPDAGVALAASP